MKQNAVKQALRNGQCVFGVFNAVASSGLSELLGRSGFDFVIIDTEHGPGNWESVEDMVRAVEVAGGVPIIRVASSSRSDILKALDAGAYGIQAPMVETGEDVKRVLQFAKYWPVGERGLAFSARAGGYSTFDKQEHLRSSNDEVLVIVQIETARAVGRLDEILQAGISDSGQQCIDVVFVGLSDLSHSIGVPGQPNHPKVCEMAETVLLKCKAAGVPVGTIVGSPADAMEWISKGVSYFTTTVPGLLLKACRDFLSGVGR